MADRPRQEEAPTPASTWKDANPVQIRINSKSFVNGFKSPLGVENYLGVPYGRIPGRFLPSSIAELDCTEGDIDALRYGPRCPQATRATGDEQALQPISELECLHLSIYKPPEGTAGGPFPVFVWIFGGAYVVGHNGSACDGNELVDKSVAAGRPIVVVALNHRLNFFGFFTSREVLEFQESKGYRPEMMPGYGDQRNALLWIKKYIQLFNGDPDRVTLSGTSSGGVSIYHHLRGRERNLFKHCIIRSGPPRDDGTFEDHQARFDRVIADMEIAQDASALEKVAALEELTAEDLVSKMDGTLFQPCPDPEWLVAPEPGLTLHDLEYWTDLPEWISTVTMGATRHESIVFGSRWKDFTDEQVDILFRNHFSPALYGTVVSSPLYRNEPSPFERFLTMSSEAIFIDCTVAAAEKMTQRNTQPVFLYIVDTKDTKPGPTEGYAAHGSDSAYIWGCQDFNKFTEAASTTAAIRESLFATVYDQIPWEATGAPTVYKSFEGSRTCVRKIQEDLSTGRRYLFDDDAMRKDFHRQGFDCTVTAVKQSFA